MLEYLIDLCLLNIMYAEQETKSILIEVIPLDKRLIPQI